MREFKELQIYTASKQEASINFHKGLFVGGLIVLIEVGLIALFK